MKNDLKVSAEQYSKFIEGGKSISGELGRTSTIPAGMKIRASTVRLRPPHPMQRPDCCWKPGFRLIGSNPLDDGVC